jgi:hypothetical protein
MVPVVLVDPPAVAQSNSQVGMEESHDVVDPPGAEDLRGPGIMANETPLGENERQEGGHEQLPPRVAQADKDRPAGQQEQSGRRYLRDVVTGTPGRADLRFSPGEARLSIRFLEAPRQSSLPAPLA